MSMLGSRWGNSEGRTNGGWGGQNGEGIELEKQSLISKSSKMAINLHRIET